MVRFLSADWLDAVLAAIDAPADARLAVQFAVEDTRFWIRFEGEHVTGRHGEIDDPDLVLDIDADAAAEVAKGLALQAAFMQGRLRISGNVSQLIHQQGAIAAIGPAMTDVEAGG